MNYRPLGTTDVKVSEISFGCWTMGGLNWVNGQPNGWANVNETDIVAGIKTALDAGVNHFDNADVYGNGKAERMLARVFDQLGVKSTDYVIATKIGHFPGTAEHAYTPAHIRHQCEQSLINLKRDHIDVYYFHHGDFGENAKYLPEAAATLDKLVAEGKVRVKGQSAYSAADFERAVPVVKPAVLQSWAQRAGRSVRPPGQPREQADGRIRHDVCRLQPARASPPARQIRPEKPAAVRTRRSPQRQQRVFRRGHRKAQAQTRQAQIPLRREHRRIGQRGAELHPGDAPRGVRDPRLPQRCQARCNVAGAGKTLSADDIKFVQETLA
ncbi:MAG: aldo/keto reductase [Tepidisphaeraceae bacterium]